MAFGVSGTFDDDPDCGDLCPGLSFDRRIQVRDPLTRQNNLTERQVGVTTVYQCQTLDGNPKRMMSEEVKDPEDLLFSI